ncbi:MAG: hypothetical protein ABI894_01900 [Ilumatobacteraceae bacterium]
MRRARSVGGGGLLHQLAWVRLIVARHPWIYWLSVMVVAGMVGLGVVRAMADIDAARRSWGEKQTVWIASAAIEPGQAISATGRSVPRAVVPIGAVDSAPDGSMARQHIGLGEIIVTSDLSAGGSVGLIPVGWVGFAVTAPVAHFSVGDHLNVYSGDQFVGAGVVIGVGESDLMVAVEADAAPALSTGVLSGTLTLALTRGP